MYHSNVGAHLRRIVELGLPCALILIELWIKDMGNSQDFQSIGLFVHFNLELCEDRSMMHHLWYLVSHEE